MSFSRIAAQLFSASKSRPKSKRINKLRRKQQRRKASLGVETLESRIAMAVDVSLVADIAPGFLSALPSDLVNFNGTIFFAADNGTSGKELYKSDGTAGGTSLVKDILPGINSSNPRDLTLVTDANGVTTLYFIANDGLTGDELWKSDGTNQGTVQVKDILVGASSSLPAELTAMNGKLFFTATDNATGGRELFSSDGTGANTTVLKEIVAAAAGSDPRNLVNVNGTLFFAANDGVIGNELWKSNGTTAGTVPVKDIFAGAATATNNSNPSNLTNVNGTLFFSATTTIGTVLGTELWKSDGSDAGTVPVFDIQTGGGSSNPQFLTNVNGTLFFAATSNIAGAQGTELWRTDGITTAPVLDIVAGAGSSSPSNLTNVNGTLFFAATNAALGRELWKSDGSPGNTVPVKNIAAVGSSNPSNLANVDGTLYFSATDGVNGTELWLSNGTDAGTVLVEDINPLGGNSYPTEITNINGTVFFTAIDGSGRELRVIAQTDFGDAPAPFPTLEADNGPRHVALGARFGQNRDGELVGQPTTGATGDDVTGVVDDEDGFISQTVFSAGSNASVTLDVRGISGIYRVSGWIDFNRDGDWTDAGEQIAASVPVGTDGNLILPFVVPANAVQGTAHARFRISTQDGLGFVGPAPDGEVEDHLLSISLPLDLVVTQVESVSSVVAGSGAGNLSYTVTVRNNGITNATGVVLSQDFMPGNLPLPTGVSFFSAVPSLGTSYSVLANGDGVWNVGNLAVGQTATLTVSLTVGATAIPGIDAITSTATVTASDQARVNLGDDTDTETTNIVAQSTAVITAATFNVGEGLPITLSGATSAAPAGAVITKFEWDLNFNGTTFVANPALTQNTALFDAAGIDGPATRVVALRTTDSTTATSIATRTIFIDNRNPSVTTVTVPAGVNIGTPVNLAATGVDPAGLVADPLTFTWTVTRPDLTTFTLTGAATAFVPNQLGNHLVNLTITDGDGGSGTTSQRTVNVVPGPNNVQAAIVGNRLVITGDINTNDIRLDLGAGGFKDTFRLTGLNGTTINGLALPLGGGGISGGISILLGAGADIVTINGNKVKGPIVLNDTGGDDVYRIGATGARFDLTDATGNDTLDFSTQTKRVKIDLGKVNGVSQTLGNGNSVRLRSQLENVIGTAFNDILKGNGASNRLEGRGGNDTLDGREGNDILVGGDGKDTLKAGVGFDILIGGTGLDKLTGSKLGNSLLIGGSTAFDVNNVAALDAFLAEWAREVAPGVPANVGTRRANIQAGVGAGPFALTKVGPPQTVFDDGLADIVKTLGVDNFTYLGAGDKRKGVVPGGQDI